MCAQQTTIAAFAMLLQRDVSVRHAVTLNKGAKYKVLTIASLCNTTRS